MIGATILFGLFTSLLIGITPAAAQEDVYSALSWEDRWATADSLMAASRQSSSSFTESMSRLDEALRAHPSHYKSWHMRWKLLSWGGRQNGIADSVIAVLIEADLPKVAAGDDHPDRPHVLSQGLAEMYRLTGREEHRTRGRQVLRDHLEAHPESGRGFQFRVTLGSTARDDAEARQWFQAATAHHRFPHHDLSLARSMAQRDLVNGFLTPAEVDSVYAWWVRGATSARGQGVNPIEMIQRALWRGRSELVHGGALETVEGQLREIDTLRPGLAAYEQRVRQVRPDAPLAPLAAMDASTDQLRGDLAMASGDSARALALYRSAWQHIAPAETMEGRDLPEDVVRLRAQLLPLIGDAGQ